MKKEILSVIILVLTVIGMPSFAAFNGKVSQGHYYDPVSTIMKQDDFDSKIKTEEYWNKNIMRTNKFQPVFILSNKELIDLMPKESEPTSIVDRIVAPSVYNISLKNASVIQVSFAQNNQNATKVQISKKETPTLRKKEPAQASINHSNDALTILYERAKNEEIDTDEMIDVAIKLRQTNSNSNCIKALDILNEITKKEPYNAYAYYLKGELFSHKKDYQNAMKCYLESLKINPTSKQCYLGIAKVLEPTNKNLAQKYYEKAK